MRMNAFSIVVEAREWVLAYTDGLLTDTLGPGRFPKRRRTRYVPVHQADRLTLLATQEVPTSDGVQLKASAAVRWRVVDPVAYVEAAADPDGLVYLAAQVALRVVLSELSIDGVQAALRSESVTDRLRDLTAVEAEGVGVEIGSVVLKDLVLPGELREATLELAAAPHPRGWPSSRPRAPRRLRCVRSRTPPNCSTSTRRWLSCGWCRPCPWGRLSSSR